MHNARAVIEQATAAGPEDRAESLPRAGRRCVTIIALVLTGLVAAACTAGPQAEPGPPIDEIEQGLDDYLSVSDEADLLRGLLVAHDGEVVIERYDGATADDHWNCWSVTKSVMSILIGIAVDEGLIPGVGSTLAELLPSFAADMTPDVAGITLRQLLTHTAGMQPAGPAEDFWRSEDWVRSILLTRAADGPGDGGFVYSNGGSHLLSAILVEATDESVLEYARARLFDPLGIPSEPALEQRVTPGTVTDRTLIAEYQDAGFAWPTDPQGYHLGWAYLKLRPQDLLTLGQLYLDEGAARAGDQIVPATWVTESTTAQVDGAGGYDYGYQWWISDADGEASFVAQGSGGQLIQVVPARELVVVTMAEMDELDLPPPRMILDSQALESMSTIVIVPRFPPD